MPCTFFYGLVMGDDTSFQHPQTGYGNQVPSKFDDVFNNKEMENWSTFVCVHHFGFRPFLNLS